MSFILQTIAHTPPFVFVLLAFLVWQGVRGLRTRTQPVGAVVIAPAAFAVAGLALLARGGHGPMALALWLAAALASTPLGLATPPRILAVDAGRRTVTRAGSAVPLLRNMTVFALQYAVALAQAQHLSGQGAADAAAGAVSGASLGYAVGWALGFRSRYRGLTGPRREPPAGAGWRPTE